MRLPSPPLLVITDCESARGDVIDILRAGFAAGLRWAMLRDKVVDRAALTELARRAVLAAEPFGATILVNGDAEAAIEAGAAGVHLPQGMKVDEARRTVGLGGLVGVSAHSEDEAVRARKEGADYVTLSPIFLTESKPGYGPALGIAEFGRIARAAGLPVLALGGIGPGNARACTEAGAAGIAVMGGVMRAADPGREVAALIAALDRAARIG
jgi:thiamine-phosphate pyrophosphorylase